MARSRMGGHTAKPRKSERRDLKRIAKIAAAWALPTERGEAARFFFAPKDENTFNAFMRTLRTTSLGYVAYGTTLRGRGNGRLVIIN